MVIINHPPKVGVSIIIIDQRRVADAFGLQELYEEIVKAVERGKKKNVVLNFALVETVTSSGLSMLIRAKARFDKEGATLHLCSLGTNVAEVIQATKLYQLFPVHVDVAAALRTI